jgi:hypothetical protein
VEREDVDVSVEEERGGGAMDEPTLSSPLLPVVVRDVSGLDIGAAPIDVPMRGEDGRLCVVGWDCADIEEAKVVWVIEGLCGGRRKSVISFSFFGFGEEY